MSSAKTKPKNKTNKTGEDKMQNFISQRGAIGAPNRNIANDDAVERLVSPSKTQATNTKHPDVVYSDVELTDEQVKAMWALHPEIENDEVIDSL